jgi:preprotein translocase subunit SecE
MSTVENVKSVPARTGGGEGGGRITGWWDNSRTFLTEVRNEMKRVTWPSQKEVYATTVVVILTSTFFGLYLWGLDLALSAAVNWVFRQFGAA